MGFSPVGAGDQSLMHFSFSTDSGVFPLIGIASTVISTHFLNVVNTSLRVGTGTWTITNAASGLADYAPSASDVAMPGIYKLYPVIQLSTGPKAFDPQILEILNLP